MRGAQIVHRHVGAQPVHLHALDEIGDEAGFHRKPERAVRFGDEAFDLHLTLWAEQREPAAGAHQRLVEPAGQHIVEQLLRIGSGKAEQRAVERWLIRHGSLLAGGNPRLAKG